MTKPKKEVTPTVEIDEDFDELDTEEVEAPVKKANTRPKTNTDQSVNVSIAELSSLISASVTQSIAPLAEKIDTIQEQVADIQATVKKHGRAIVKLQNHEVIDMPTTAIPAPATPVATTEVVAVEAPAAPTPPEKRGILDSTLGTVGNLLHGVIDTSAFVLESAVDLVTLGRAKR